MNYFKRFTDFCAGFALFSALLLLFRKYMAFTPEQDVPMKEKLKLFFEGGTLNNYKIWLPFLMLLLVSLTVSILFRRLPWLAFPVSVLPFAYAVMMFHDNKLYEYPMLYLILCGLHLTGNLVESLRLDRTDGKRRGMLCTAFSSLSVSLFCLFVKHREHAIAGLPHDTEFKPFDFEIYGFANDSDMKIFWTLAAIGAAVLLLDLLFNRSHWVSAILSALPAILAVYRWNTGKLAVHADLLTTFCIICFLTHLIVTFSDSGVADTAAPSIRNSSREDSAENR